MVNRIAAWEAKDGTVHKTREEADRHDFEQFASTRLRQFQQVHFADAERRWSTDEIYQVLLRHAQELSRCFPPRGNSLAEALASPSVVRRQPVATGHAPALADSRLASRNGQAH